jgi:hypothetical protein
MKDRNLTIQHWRGQLSAGVIAGAFLSTAILAVTGTLCGANASPMAISSQALMWLTAFVWTLCICSCFLFASGLRAWLILSGSALILWALFALLKHAGLS